MRVLFWQWCMIKENKSANALVLRRLGLKCHISEKDESILLFFKLLKFIIVSFHLALTRFVFKNSFRIFLFIYIFIWFEVSEAHTGSLTSWTQNVYILFSRNQKSCYPRSLFLFFISYSFVDSFLVWFVKLLPKKNKKKKGKCIFMWYILTITWVAVVVGDGPAVTYCKALLYIQGKTCEPIVVKWHILWWILAFFLITFSSFFKICCCPSTHLILYYCLFLSG